jgi:hypothetical protein
MVGQPGFFDGEERLKALSAAGDPLERLARVVDFEVFRGDLAAALSRSDRAKGGRPAYDAVLMFKVLVLQTLYTLSDDQTEYQLRDRWSFMRFVGLALRDPVPDAKTIGLFREQQLARAGATERLFTWLGSTIEPRRHDGNTPQTKLTTRQTRSARRSPDRKSSPSIRLPPPIMVQIRFFEGPIDQAEATDFPQIRPLSQFRHRFARQ